MQEKSRVTSSEELRARRREYNAREKAARKAQLQADREKRARIREVDALNWSVAREIKRGILLLTQAVITGAIALFLWGLMADASSLFEGTVHNIFTGLVAFGMWCGALSEIRTPLPRFRRPR